jgi:hypothetical protein
MLCELAGGDFFLHGGRQKGRTAFGGTKSRSTGFPRRPDQPIALSRGLSLAVTTFQSEVHFPSAACDSRCVSRRSNDQVLFRVIVFPAASFEMC